MSVVTKTKKSTTTEPPAVKYREAGAPTRLSTRIRKVVRFVWPQWLRTILVVVLWLGLSPFYIGLIATYGVYNSAQSMVVGLAIFSGLAPHLWPSRTCPWRTVAWTGVVTSALGMALLNMGLGRFSLMIVTIVGFLIVVLRANQNARRLWKLFQTYRASR